MAAGDADPDPLVEDYMSRDVETVTPDETVAEVARLVADSDYDGFPVTDRRRVVGFVGARDLLLADDREPVFKLMSTDLIVARPEMKVTDAARVILRSGINRLPVVDDAGHLVGIIGNADVIRSQIERATPEKVVKLVDTLESIHDVSLRRERRTVALAELVPTQGTVYADELEGRQYELQEGLAEPLVVIDNDGELLLADGHHRVKAARRLDVDEMDAYVVRADEPVDFGIARTARRSGLASLEDVDIVDYAHHPLVETTERLR
jgi:IMP dehydrogenase